MGISEERIKDFVMYASEYDKLRLEQTIKKEFQLNDSMEIMN